MVKQMVTEHNPQVNNQADAQKTANEGFQKKGQAGSEALSLLQRKELLIQIMRNDEEHGLYGFYRLPEVSGFRMARKV